MYKRQPFESYVHAPHEIQEKITPDAPYLIIDSKPIEINLRVDEKQRTIVPYVKIKEKIIDLETEDAVAHFILSQIKLKPKIRKSATVFQLVDTELEKIRGKVEQSAIESEEPNLLATLGLDETLKKLKLELEKIDSNKLKNDKKISYQKQLNQLNKLQNEYIRLSSEWRTLRKDIEDVKKQFEGGEITFEQFNAVKVRRTKALKKVELMLIDFQDKLKNQFAPSLEKFIASLEASKNERK